MNNKKLIVRNRVDSEEWAVIYMFNTILKFLKKTYPEIEFIFEPIMHFPYYEGSPRQGSLIIENPINKKVILLTYDDVPRDIIKQTHGTGWTVSNIQQMFCVSNITDIKTQKGFYLQLSSIDVDVVIKPFSYVVYRTAFDKEYADKAYTGKKSAAYRKNGMLFRGLFYGEREYYNKNNKHSEIICTNDHYKGLESYVEELVTYKCGLSFTGAAEICHRDLEYFALGMPVIRPELKNTQFLEPLIPGYHYISTEAGSHEEKMHSINKKWDEVKNDFDLLDFIGNNARDWYLRNGKLDTQAQLFVNSVDLKLILD